VDLKISPVLEENVDEKLTVTPIAAPPAPAPRRSSAAGCVAIAAGVGLAFSLLLNFVLIGAKAGSGLQEGPSSLHEKAIEGEGDDKVVEIDVEGVIAEHADAGFLGVSSGESLPKRIKDQLEKAEKDTDVKAVILAVNSPGGTVTASDEIWNYLVQFRDSSKKPLLVHQGALAASGGYYISAAADEIVCEPTTITGSIGVIMEGMNFSKFMTDHGVADMTIKSGPNKDLGSPFKPINDEHVKILQGMVDDMYERFTHVVAEGIVHRTKKASLEQVLPDVKKLADGRIYTANQALELKLVDKIGYMEDTLAEARRLANIPKAKLVRYTKQPSLMDVLSGNVETKLSISLDDFRSPRLLMLWRGE
jgi:protease-4